MASRMWTQVVSPTGRLILTHLQPVIVPARYTAEASGSWQYLQEWGTQAVLLPHLKTVGTRPPRTGALLWPSVWALGRGGESWSRRGAGCSGGEENRWLRGTVGEEGGHCSGSSATSGSEQLVWANSAGYCDGSQGTFLLRPANQSREERPAWRQQVRRTGGSKEDYPDIDVRRWSALVGALAASLLTGQPPAEDKESELARRGAPRTWPERGAGWVWALRGMGEGSWSSP